MLTIKQASERGYRIDWTNLTRPIAFKGSPLNPSEMLPCFNGIEEALVRHLKALITNPTEDQRDAARNLLAQFHQ